jgi:hypothetical protein
VCQWAEREVPLLYFPYSLAGLVPIVGLMAAVVVQHLDGVGFLLGQMFISKVVSKDADPSRKRDDILGSCVIPIIYGVFRGFFLTYPIPLLRGAMKS